MPCFLPIFGVRAFNVLTLFEVSFQVHGEQRRTGGVVGAAHWPVVTTHLMLSAWTERQGEGKRTGEKVDKNGQW